MIVLLANLHAENIEKERHVPWDSMPNRGNAPRPGAVKRESDLLEEDRGMPVWYTESNKSRTGRGTQVRESRGYTESNKRSVNLWRTDIRTLFYLGHRFARAD